jgi:cytoskeletal protein CcmA (bactofilin family)
MMENFFSKKEGTLVKKHNSKNLSIIDRDLRIDGSISSKGNLIIRGMVEGTLVGEKVVIAEEGSVNANTQVASLTIGGKFEGEIRATKELIILSTGSCSGSVICKNLTVESGGILNANVTHEKPETVVKSETKTGVKKDDKKESKIVV